MKPAHREWLDAIWRRLLLAHEQEEHCAWK
jgi:hypothetical protein